MRLILTLECAGLFFSIVLYIRVKRFWNKNKYIWAGLYIYIIHIFGWLWFAIASHLSDRLPRPKGKVTFIYIFTLYYVLKQL